MSHLSVYTIEDSSQYKPLILGYFWLQTLQFHKILSDTVIDQITLLQIGNFRKFWDFIFEFLNEKIRILHHYGTTNRRSSTAFRTGNEKCVMARLSRQRKIVFTCWKHVICNNSFVVNDGNFCGLIGREGYIWKNLTRRFQSFLWVILSV